LLSSILFTLASVLVPCGTPSGSQSVPRPDLDSALAAWRAEFGASWIVAQDRETGWAEMLYGGRTPASAREPRVDEDYVALAGAALERTLALHGLELSTLTFQETHFLPLGQIGSGDKQTVRYRQSVHGVPVEGAFLNLLFSASGELRSLQSSALPGASAIEVVPRLDAGDAAAFARAHFQAATHFEAQTSGAPELLIVQLAGAAGRTGRLAWKLECGWTMPDSEPLRKLVYVDARDGALLRMDEGIQHFDVVGNVGSLASPGTLPDIASNPEATLPLAYVQCTSGATNVFSDAAGNFAFPGLSGSPNVTFSFSGTYARVVNNGGANESLTLALPAGTPNSVLLNPAAIAAVTAQANAYIVSTRMRDWIRSIDPNDVHGDFQTLANVAVTGTCNAYYDGSSINFFNEGGGCANTAYSTVVSHEQGHWLNDRYGTGNGGDGMGEGNADTFAMYMWDNPIVAEWFYNSGNFIRTGTNLRQFCGDTHPGCYGEVHADGEVWMGAAWKVRDNLNTTLGNTLGDLTANTLFIAWMNGYNQSQIKSIIETQWVTLDDDDGILQNGSPHFADIDAGFRTQGFPGLSACQLMANVCQSSINSTGHAAIMDSSGLNQIATNNLELYAIGLPPGKLGLFLMGQTQTLLPFGNGWRCISNPLQRLPPTNANIFGDLYWPLDLNALPGGLQIHAGETWYFLAWFRDPAAGGANFNTSDALQVPWCP
jgi:hypothetical protein